MDNVLQISDSEVKDVLDWNILIPVVKQSLIAISNTQPTDGSTRYKDLKAVQSPRTFTHLPDKSGFLISMPGFIGGLDVDGTGAQTHSSLACKLITVFNGNATRTPPLPTLNGCILMFDDKTGTVDALMDAGAITQWRTAAVTCVATSLLWAGRAGGDPGAKNPAKILAIFGAGKQGRIHAIAMQKQFGFDEIRIWNRTPSRAQELVTELRGMNLGAKILFRQSREICAQGADVIVTATSAAVTLLQDDWIKAGAHINGVGVGVGQEISDEIYKRASVYVESMEIGQKELPTRNIIGALGQISLGIIDPPQLGTTTIFQSLGVGVEDAAVAKMVYNLIKKKKASQTSG